MVAAGHPLTAEVGARVLREGGNAVDSAIAAVLASWVCEPLLTGPGAGGYMLVAGAGEEPTLLDFFVAAPGMEASADGYAPLVPVEVCFGAATQVFNFGASSCGVPGSPAGLAAAADLWGVVPLDQLVAPAVRMAREGVAMNAQQAYVFELLEGMFFVTEEGAGELAPERTPLREGEIYRSGELADTIERLGRDGAGPFYTGDIASAIAERCSRLGGLLSGADLAAYQAIERTPARISFRGREILTNPPPSAGGTLLALAFARLDAGGERPDIATLVEVMEEVQALRTPQFTAGLSDPGFLERFLAANLGSTTHLSVIDSDGRSCSVTCTNGAGSGVVIPGTGIHLNNIMGEEDLNPLGFFHEPAGLRMPSMMAPTAVVDSDGEVELALGSAGSNRIRSAILQVVVNAIDGGMDAAQAIRAPRVHVEGGIVYAEPGLDLASLERDGRGLVRFGEPNLFFGGVQAVERDPRSGALSGAGDPRRGGATVAA